MTDTADLLIHLSLLRALLTLETIEPAVLATTSGASVSQALAFLRDERIQAWLVPTGAADTWTVAPAQREAALLYLQARIPHPSRLYRPKCPHTVALAQMGRWDRLLQESLELALAGEVTSADERMPAMNRMSNLAKIAAFQCEVYPWTDLVAKRQAMATLDAHKEAWKAAARPWMEEYNTELAEHGMPLDEYRLL